MSRCITCNKYIPVNRLLFLRDTNKKMTCLEHSKEEPTVGFFIYAHKTAGSIVIVPKDEDGQNDPNKIEIARRAYRRSR